MRIDVGIDGSHREEISRGLAHFLADTYTLYLKTQNYHWNVTGHLFQPLHSMFESQYNELALAVDDIAERIRFLGVKAPGTYSDFMKLTSLKEKNEEMSAVEMITDLVHGHEAVIKTARRIFPLITDANDGSTAEFILERLRRHEKTAWKLWSFLE